MAWHNFKAFDNMYNFSCYNTKKIESLLYKFMNVHEFIDKTTISYFTLIVLVLGFTQVLEIEFANVMLYYENKLSMIPNRTWLIHKPHPTFRLNWIMVWSVEVGTYALYDK